METVLESILESIAEEFYALDAQWRVIYVNRRGQQAWRRSREEMLGRVVWEVFPEAVGTPFYYAQQEAMRERRAVHVEAVSPVRNRWVEGNIYPTEDGGISLYIRDCHERKTAEETLRGSEERYRRLLDTAIVIVGCKMALPRFR